MRKQPNPFHYFLWIFILSIPFYIAGQLDSDFLPVDLPISALMVVCPMLSIWVYDSGDKLKHVIGKAFQFNLKLAKGYVLAMLIMPITILLTYFLMKSWGIEFSPVRLSFAEVSVLFSLFLTASFTEEVGWAGYAANELLKKHSFLFTGFLIGVVWALWHIPPYLQMGKELSWIFWQCIGTILNRIVMVRIFIKFDRSILTSILFHTSINLSVFVFPVMGSHYDPFYFTMTLSILMMIYCLAVILLKSLSHHVKNIKES